MIGAGAALYADRRAGCQGPGQTITIITITTICIIIIIIVSSSSSSTSSSSISIIIIIIYIITITAWASPNRGFRIRGNVPRAHAKTVVQGSLSQGLGQNITHQISQSVCVYLVSFCTFYIQFNL